MSSAAASAPCEQAAFHGLAGSVVRLLEPSSEADPAALLVETLASMGSIFGRSAYAAVGTAVHAPQLFAVLVGGTSAGRKGSAARDVATVMREVDPRWSATCNHTGIVSGEGLLELVRDATWETKTRRHRGETRYERVCVDFGQTDKRCHVREPEFGRVLRAIKCGSLASVLRDAWDGGDLGSASRKDPIRCTATHISVAGHVTLEEFCREVDVVDAANGLLNRFLWIHVGRSKVLAIPEPVNAAQLAGLAAEMRQAVAAARDRGALTFSASAKAMWIEQYATRLCPSDPRVGLEGALLARAAPQVLRLALIYALLDRSWAIDVAHLRAALALWSHVEATCAWMAAQIAAVSA